MNKDKDNNISSVEKPIDNCEKKVVLGLDISTHCTGISIVYVDENYKLTPIVVTHLRHKLSKKIKGIESLFMKCNMFMSKLEEILTENKLYNNKEGLRECRITDVVIEEPLLSSNNQDTVATLLRYNGMVAMNVYNMLGLVPQFISSNDARKFGLPVLMSIRKFNKKGEAYPYKKIMHAISKDELVLFGSYPFDCAKKLIIWNYISEMFPGIKWVYNNNNNELSTENFDASDSLICVMGYINKLRYYGTVPKIVNLITDNLPNSSIVKITYEYTFCGETFTKSITCE